MHVLYVLKSCTSTLTKAHPRAPTHMHTYYIHVCTQRCIHTHIHLAGPSRHRQDEHKHARAHAHTREHTGTYPLPPPSPPTHTNTHAHTHSHTSKCTYTCAHTYLAGSSRHGQNTHSEGHPQRLARCGLSALPRILAARGGKAAGHHPGAKGAACAELGGYG